ncbi:hypothetical protein B0A50_06709 [Salinomyces thailandicus]|uniref:Uncharacterized protein n=1 Tax=Salinomyces thailandicus TaxID=706561 RepID=A0A4V5N3N8_9PEZI|nr:hypothetical protein B0A50_06709 [Salinomyces thailandica]
MPNIVLLGTCDTKLDELLYLRSQILESSSNDSRVTLVDVGRSPVEHEHINISQKTLTSQYTPQQDAKEVGTLARGEVIKYMIACATNWLRETYERGSKDPTKAIHGCVAAGGTGGTSLAASVMRAVLPIGFPKLILSTNASGDTRPVIGETDITLMYSVCDVAGLNYLLRRILANAAGSIVGMASAYERLTSQEANQEGSSQRKKRVGLTMFGVTTPCVDKIRQHLEANYPIECIVFHCTGAGGRAMERLVKEGVLEAVLDVTTTELCDQLCGGVMDAGPERLEAPLKAGIPYIISVGATDMVNFGPKSTMPERYANRQLFEHNPTVTLMRTSPAECTAIGQCIVDKIKKFGLRKELVQVVLPTGGVSMIAVPGGPFHDGKADEALFSTIKNGLIGTGISLIEDRRDVNDEGFAVEIAERLVKAMDLSR